MKIDVFLQGEGLKNVVLIQIPIDAIVRDLVEAAKKHGLSHDGDENPARVFLEEMEDFLDPSMPLEHAGIHHKSHVHIHRSHRINVIVNFNGQQEQHIFSPSTTVGRIKKTAVKAFHMSEVDAAEHVLQVSGTNDRPDESVHIGTLVNFPCEQLNFDLVPKVRIEG